MLWRYTFIMNTTLCPWTYVLSTEITIYTLLHYKDVLYEDKYYLHVIKNEKALDTVKSTQRQISSFLPAA